MGGRGKMMVASRQPQQHPPVSKPHAAWNCCLGRLRDKDHRPIGLPRSGPFIFPASIARESDTHTHTEKELMVSSASGGVRN